MKNGILFLMISICLVFSCSSKTAQKQTIDPEKEKIVNDWNQFKEEFKSLPQGSYYKTDIDSNAPKTITEGFEMLKKDLSPEDLEMIKNSNENEAVSFHFGLGMGIRNSWGLWHGSKISTYLYSRGISHPDDMSGFIIRSFIKYLQGKEWQLEIEKKYPEHFKIVDAVLEGNISKLKTLTEKLDALPEKGDIPSAMDIAMKSCNYISCTVLQKFSVEKDIPFEKVFYCDESFFIDFIQNRKQLLKDSSFVKIMAEKTGIISKFCDSIPTFDEQIEKELFDAILFSGDDSDFECTQRKFKSKPEITFRHFYAKNMSEKKENFILENMSSDMFSDRMKVKGILSYFSMLESDTDRIKKFIKIASVTKNELGDIGFIYGVMRRNDTKLLDMLFENGFSPHYILVIPQQTLLDSAISNCNPVAVDYLLEKGADPNYRVNRMSSPLTFLNGCYRTKDPEKEKEVFVKYLITKGLSVRGKGGEILPMSSLTGESSLDLLKFMEKQGYDFSHASNVDDYSNPLTASVSNKDPQVFDWLISKHGFDANRPDKDGDTPLHEMARRMDKKGVEFLIKKGASLSIKNKDGKTPLDLAKERLSQEIQRDREYKEYLKNKDKKGKKHFKGECDCETAGDYESDRIKEANEMIELLEKK